MIVVDASVVASALVETGARGDDARRVLAGDTAWFAPEHLAAEVFSVIRGLHRGGTLDDERGRLALRRFSDMVIETVAVSTLFAPMWSMRHNISGYDAAYVALALMLECPLVTCDRRLAHAAPRGVQVHIVGGDQPARAG